MYYVIKKQHATPLSTFIGFPVRKFIASKNSDNVIFEFQKDGKPLRKWVKKEDIILLTDNKEYYQKTLKHFSEIESTQKKLVEEAQAHLKNSMETFTDTMHTEMDEYEELRDSSDVPCMLRHL
ncbi:hypothetical protein M947_08300 [Sulfurimonas hongkongensis]|uniref:Uncharacterized protein n=1 Tax=Sulfurimonas hongkongensis TaxID=1172190 RepID=T0JM56_9BACT|nr:hypothetical protein [Sulfurimonas hongkongensis]EQB39151.1 hypothetical protein M947_08300 [Sulfurimonas hongkongensis]